jgi:ParB family chromosome partitioning protein
MSKFGSNIISKTGGIKPRERNEALTDPVKMKTPPARFLDAQHKADNLEKENQVLRNRMVSIAELSIVEGRKRSLSEQEFAELKANLATFPLINPVTIRALKEGGFELVAGHNRVEAYIAICCLQNCRTMKSIWDSNRSSKRQENLRLIWRRRVDFHLR